MNPSAGQIVCVIVGVVIGWFCHLGYDAFVDWWYDVTGRVASLLWDLSAILGIVAIIAAGAGIWWWTSR